MGGDIVCHSAVERGLLRAGEGEGIAGEGVEWFEPSAIEHGELAEAERYFSLGIAFTIFWIPEGPSRKRFLPE